MYLLVLYIPFITSLFYFFFGKSFGIKGVQLVIKFKLFLLFVITSFIFYEIYFNETIVEIALSQWIFNGIYISFRFDFFSSIILSLIVIVFSVVVLYSFWYMLDDPFIIRFLGFLSIFTFMMIFLIISNNFLTMFIGWEGVGLTSYFLINFWYLIIQANKSAIKAILYNKIGDIFFMLGLILTILYQNHSNIDPFYIRILDANPIFWISLFFIIAAMAKSAQFFFDSWLGDAMMGPTPVSALLHAATMVTAGVYLLIRLLPTFVLPNSILYIGTTIGLLTIILGGIIALFQNDIKKIIAYSTCSQLGYMFYSIFIGISLNSYFHLFIHGFFKGLLFLSGGIIIHNIALNQDSRKSSSLIFLFPISYLFFLVGTFSIVSLPFFSGFYSKEAIINYSLLSPFYTYFITILGALLTVCYSFKLIFTVFFGSPSFYLRFYTSCESLFITVFLLILGSIFIGFFALPSFFAPSFMNNNLTSFNHTFDLELIPVFIKLLPVLTIPIGMFIGFFFNKIFILSIYDSIKWLIPLYTIFNKRFFFESIYNFFISYIIYNIIFKTIENGLLDVHSFYKRFLFTKS